jgi:probable HAF family extracellular repeat protein/uncharacterized repeat protein (TIGR03803 family)/VCBS repeat-containing protein
MTYTYTILNYPAADTNLPAYGINDSGQIVGIYQQPNSLFYGFLYSNGSYTTINDPLATQGTEAYGINDSGQIVGDYYGGNSGIHGFLYSNGSYATLSDPSGIATDAHGINDSGQIVGSYLDSSLLFHGFIYSNRAYTTLDDPSGTSTIANGINNSGQIVGTYQNSSGYHGFLYSHGSYTTIDDPLGTQGTEAYGINQSGEIVGYYIDSSGIYHGFVYNNGTYTTIADPLPANQHTTVFGINDLGEIVGYAGGNAFGIGPGYLGIPNIPNPTVVADRAHVQEGDSIRANAAHGVLANDSDPIPHDTLTVSAVDGQANNVGHAIAGTFGTLKLNADGSYTYDATDHDKHDAADRHKHHAADHDKHDAADHHKHHAASDGVGLDTFTYTAQDGAGGTATTTLTVVVTEPDQSHFGGTAGVTKDHHAVTTDFHTNKDEGHFHHADLANLAAMARSIFHQVGATEVAQPELTTLVSFNSTNGSLPLGGLIADAHGNLFGTTNEGGRDQGGTVFEVAKTADGYASTPTTLVSFNITDGRQPYGSLFADAHGNLFGTTAGGGANGAGTVFEIAKTADGYASTPTTLVSFNGTNGADPLAGLIADGHGDFFGTTAEGGANDAGTVFEVAKTAHGYASTPATLVSFNGANGLHPEASLIADAHGNLFGTTLEGGANGAGTVFEVAKTAHGYASTPTTLISFDDPHAPGPQGSEAGLIADNHGNLFGTTIIGGAYGDGMVFEIAKTADGYASTPTTLVSFNGTNGAFPSPFGSLIADAHGDLFGMTAGGGANDRGTVFEITKTADGYASTPTTLINFNGTNGWRPFGSLIADNHGDLFGTTTLGGPTHDGTVFEITGSGFGGPPDVKGGHGSFSAQSDGSGGASITDPPPANMVSHTNDTFLSRPISGSKRLPSSTYTTTRLTHLSPSSPSSLNYFLSRTKMQRIYPMMLPIPRMMLRC